MDQQPLRRINFAAEGRFVHAKIRFSCPFPVVQVASIPEDRGPQWLVDGLWAEEGVGIVGGAPKCCKTWLALDLALSVASGTPALGAYPRHLTSEPRHFATCAS